MNYTEDTLVQQTTADYLEQQLGWKSVYAYNHADPGRTGTGENSPGSEQMATLRYLKTPPGNDSPLLSPAH